MTLVLVVLTPVAMKAHLLTAILNLLLILLQVFPLNLLLPRQQASFQLLRPKSPHLLHPPSQANYPAAVQFPAHPALGVVVVVIILFNGLTPVCPIFVMRMEFAVQFHLILASNVKIIPFIARMLQ